MNRMNRKSFAALALATLMLGASATAQAEDNLTTRVATGVGRIIAMQGNAALVTIREEIRESFAGTLAPFMPEPAAAAATADPQLLPLQVRFAGFEEFVADELACPAI